MNEHKLDAHLFRSLLLNFLRLRPRQLAAASWVTRPVIYNNYNKNNVLQNIAQAARFPLTQQNDLV